MLDFVSHLTKEEVFGQEVSSANIDQEEVPKETKELVEDSTKFDNSKVKEAKVKIEIEEKKPGQENSISKLGCCPS